MAKSNMRFAALLLLAQFTSFTLAQRGTYAPTDAPTGAPTAPPTAATATPTSLAPTAAPTDTATDAPTGTPTTLAPTTSPSTLAPTESPTVPPTMPALTDAQAVASIAAARARVAYRNNAVAPASIDPVYDAELDGKKCPADYHLMGADDHSIVSGGTASPTANGDTYWCQKNDEIYKTVTYQKTLDPTGTVAALAATDATLGEARDLSQSHDVAAREQHALIEASGQTLLEQTILDADAAMVLAKTGDTRESTLAPTVTLSNSPTTIAEGADERSRAQNNSPALGR
jgi:hypothetical protein